MFSFSNQLNSVESVICVSVVFVHPLVFMRYDKKTFYVAILWTVIGIVIGLFLWWNKRSASRPKTSAPSIRVSPAVSPRRQHEQGGATSSSAQIPKSVLVTLNDIFVSSDPSMSVLGSWEMLGDLSKKVQDTYLIYTVPGELDGGDDESVRSRLEEILMSTGKFAGFKKHRLLLTNTREGRVSVARQLQVELTIDSDADLVDLMQGKVPNVVCVPSSGDFAKIFRKFFS